MVSPITATRTLRPTLHSEAPSLLQSDSHMVNEVPPSPSSVLQVHPQVHPSTLSTTTALNKRGTNVHHLSNSWILHYNIYHAFVQSWRTSAVLGYLWSQLALQALTMSDHEFEKQWLTFDMSAFEMDIFNFNGFVPRASVVAVANAMMVYSGRGFCGCFNARFVRDGETLWVTMRVAAE